MGHIDVAHLTYSLPDGRVLLSDVSFRVGEGQVAALVGPNCAGKTTLLRLIAGDIEPDEGTITTSGAVSVMRQFVGQINDGTLRDLLLSVSPASLAQAARRVDELELELMESESEEVFVVIAGEGTVTCSGGGRIDLAPGVVGLLPAGAQTTWIVTTPLRKVWITLT